jgi:hypothetical protein
MEYAINIPDAEYIKEIQARAERSGLLIRAFNGKNMFIKDYDNNKITLVL